MDHPISRARATWITIWGLIHFLFGASPDASSAGVPAGPPPAAGRRAVLVHGIYNSAESMQLIKRDLEMRGWQVYCISLKPSDASITFESMARQLDDFVSQNIPSGEKFDLVAFSMGGLVCRYYIQKMGGYARVRRFVTLSTPNHGTIWALLSGRAGVKEMRPGSAMLRDLNNNPSKLRALDYTSIYTPMDLSIVPASSSRMQCARNVILWVPLHPLMVIFSQPIREVLRALD